MKTQLLSVLLCVASGSCASQPAFEALPDFDNRYPQGAAGQTIIFIGERIGLEEIPSEQWCPSDSICLDQRLNARYRIVKLLAGDYNKPTIDFAVYDHGAIDPFWNHDPIVLYVAQFGDRLFHHKYQYDVLSPLAGGGFAFCGDPYTKYEMAQIDEFERKPLTPYSFFPPIRKELADFLPNKEDEPDLSQDTARDNFIRGMRSVAPPAFKIADGIATCRMGVSPQKLADIRMYYEYSEDAEEWFNSR